MTQQTDSGSTARERMLEIVAQLDETFIDRTDAIRCMTLAHLCEEHYLFVGTPGTAKTALARAFARHITGSRFFTVLLGAFSAPEKVFGPLDIQAFQAGKYETVTDGKLPDVEFVFLDEYFKCNEGALNEMLTALNEREFEGRDIPLMTAGTATNWPEIEQRTENTDALYDRILLRCVVDRVTGEDDTVAMLKVVKRVKGYQPRATITLDELRVAISEVRAVEIPDVLLTVLHSVRERLATREVAGQTRPGISISDRRLGALQTVLQAQAWLAGRSSVTLEDFDVLRWGLWNERDDIERVNAVLDTIDAEAVKAIIDRIDEARERHASITRSRAGAAQLNEALQLIEEVARETRTKFEQPVFTARGRQTIRESMQSLKKCFQDLDAQAREMGEKGEQS